MSIQSEPTGPDRPSDAPTDAEVEAMYDAIVSFNFPTSPKGPAFQGQPDREEIREGLSKVFRVRAAALAGTAPADPMRALLRFIEDAGNWCISPLSDGGSAWHLTAAEHNEFERLSDMAALSVGAPAVSESRTDYLKQLQRDGDLEIAKKYADDERYTDDARLMAEMICRDIAVGAPAAPTPNLLQEIANLRQLLGAAYQQMQRAGIATAELGGRTPTPEHLSQDEIKARLQLANFIDNEGPGDVPLDDLDIKLITKLLRQGIDNLT